MRVKVKDLISGTKVRWTHGGEATVYHDYSVEKFDSVSDMLDYVIVNEEGVYEVSGEREVIVDETDTLREAVALLRLWAPTTGAKVIKQMEKMIECSN